MRTRYVANSFPAKCLVTKILIMQPSQPPATSSSSSSSSLGPNFLLSTLFSNKLHTYHKT